MLWPLSRFYIKYEKKNCPITDQFCHARCKLHIRKSHAFNLKKKIKILNFILVASLLPSHLVPGRRPQTAVRSNHVQPTPDDRRLYPAGFVPCHVSENDKKFFLIILILCPISKSWRDLYTHLAHLTQCEPSNALWWHRSGLTLVQVMACCLAAPNHYLNQCWFIIKDIL